ncbi:uncharacterized protein LOC127701679 [Mytilus californianus]|uniref:uncharacterized protein LOC127701679 n=1 Tax=Mytilus californianus TaxID=6549 RepID=UPI0022467641|nr:uncharacterized protein LOC127701679 [Mytilus californianus]
MSTDLINQFKEKFTKCFRRFVFDYVKQEFDHLILRNCNGTGPWSFSDATVEYVKGKTFPVHVWIRSVYLDLARKLLIPESIYTTEENQMFKCFIEANKHQQCLAQLLRTEGKIKAEKIKCLLAMHYFKPLAFNGEYIVDSCHGYRKCELCNEPVKADQKLTSFGNSLVWHGQADIFVARSVVKIELEEALNNMSLKEDEEEEGVEDSKYSSMAEESKEEVKTLSHAIAEAIVNAFCESRGDESLFDKFIPSFLATEKNIRIILYNCKFDKLLLSTEFPIWDGKQLNIKTMMQVWLTINFLEKMNNLPCALDNSQESKFKEVVGENYGIYLRSMTRPTTILEPRDLVHMELDKADLKLIMDTNLEFFKMYESLSESGS